MIWVNDAMFLLFYSLIKPALSKLFMAIWYNG
jgi:hypothetical protein